MRRGDTLISSSIIWNFFWKEEMIEWDIANTGLWNLKSIILRKAKLSSRINYSSEVISFGNVVAIQIINLSKPTYCKTEPSYQLSAGFAQRRRFYFFPHCSTWYSITFGDSSKTINEFYDSCNMTSYKIIIIIRPSVLFMIFTITLNLLDSNRGYELRSFYRWIQVN